MEIQGIKNKNIIIKSSLKKLKETPFITAGCDLDELQINVSLKNKKEINELISFLKISEPCFNK